MSPVTSEPDDRRQRRARDNPFSTDSLDPADTSHLPDPFREDDDVIDDILYEQEPLVDPYEQAQKVLKLPQIQIGITLSAFTRFAFRMPVDSGGYEPFSFKGRRHMIPIYDTPARRVLLCTSRQCEKCGSVGDVVYYEDGRPVFLGDVKTGDSLLCMDLDRMDAGLTSGTVTWVSDRVRRPGVLVKTRQGHELRLGVEHPVRMPCEWIRAAQLRPGDRIAAARRCGTFFDEKMDPTRVELTGFLIGDGALRCGSSIGFTKSDGPAIRRVAELYEGMGEYWSSSPSNDSGTVVDVRTCSPKVRHWLEVDRLFGKYSYEREMPPWVFRLSREQTALFLNRLWATDGSVLVPEPAQYNLTYCSTSRILCRQVQALLWKFGIPSVIREFQPTYITVAGEKARLAWVLRIEGQEGIKTFLTEIGALGKSEGVPLPSWPENSNRDTLPWELHHLIRDSYDSWRGSGKRPSLHSVKLHYKLSYPPSREKVRKYISFLRQDGFDQSLVDLLEQVAFSDIYWDEVESATLIGDIECVDLSIRTHGSFLVDGVVTHNSTTLGNHILAKACLIPEFKALYVSPSSTQTKTFSADRIKDPLETSPILKAYTTTALSQNVFEKQFVNRSKLTFRYAYRTADRTRGIRADNLVMDELQDILPENITVADQCLSHGNPFWKKRIFAGTPKSLDNVIEYYRANMSTQGEWVVPCDCKGGEGGRHWNILGEQNIGKKFLICAHCKKQLFPMADGAQWAHQVAKAPWESYRINQLMVPWLDWETDIIYGYEHSPRAQFYNETLGISYDSGIRPITRMELIAACNDSVRMDSRGLVKLRRLSLSQDVVMGIDWMGDSKSYTVITLMTRVGQTLQVFFTYRCVGEYSEPKRQMDLIKDLVHRFNVKVIGADFGGGLYPNDDLIRTYGPHRVAIFQYVLRSKKKIWWNPQHRRFMVARHETMANIFNAFKRRKIRLPNWKEFEDPHGKDILNVFTQYNKALSMLQYLHGPDSPDDTLHSILYATLAHMLVHPMPEIITPVKETGGGQGNWWYQGPQWQG